MGNQPEYLDSMGRRLAFAARTVQTLTGELLAKHKLTPPQWVALTALWREDGMTVSEVARYTKAKVPAASRLLGRMEALGLVRRKSIEGDRRTIRVWLTPKSRSMRDLLNLYSEVNDLILEGFSEDEKKHLSGFLDRLTENARRQCDSTDDPLVL